MTCNCSPRCCCRRSRHAVEGNLNTSRQLTQRTQEEIDRQQQGGTDDQQADQPIDGQDAEELLSGGGLTEEQRQRIEELLQSNQSSTPVRVHGNLRGGGFGRHRRRQRADRGQTPGDGDGDARRTSAAPGRHAPNVDNRASFRPHCFPALDCPHLRRVQWGYEHHHIAQYPGACGWPAGLAIASCPGPGRCLAVGHTADGIDHPVRRPGLPVPAGGGGHPTRWVRTAAQSSANAAQSTAVTVATAERLDWIGNAATMFRQRLRELNARAGLFADRAQSTLLECSAGAP